MEKFRDLKKKWKIVIIVSLGIVSMSIIYFTIAIGFQFPTVYI